MKRRNAQSRRAITLLEVLISIGVLSVGLLGAATMLPLAKYYSEEASKFDRAAALGQEAYHDMQIRGYLSIRRWTKPSVGAFNYTNISAFVIDPLGYGYAIANGTTQPQYFPAFPNNGANPPVAGAPQVFRGSIDINNIWNDASPVPPKAATFVAMPYQVADRIFRSTDDLLFDRPERPELRPTTPSGALSPDYNGDFSWFVTLSHPPADIAAATSNNLVNAVGMQRFVASLVVFYKRQIDLNPADWPGPPTQQQPPPERLVYADFVQPPAYVNASYAPPAYTTPLPSAVAVYHGGGALRLRTIAATMSSGGGTISTRNWLDGLKPNQYIMLSANFADAAASAGGYPQLAWYRIISVDDAPQVSGGIATRLVNVTGADWPATASYNGTPIWIDADGAGGATAFCTIADGAVAVYEDVITVDHSLLRD